MYIFPPSKMLLSLLPQFRTTSPSGRLRKAALRLRQVHQMGCCSFSKLCINRTTDQIAVERMLRTDQSIGINLENFRQLATKHSCKII